MNQAKLRSDNNRGLLVCMLIFFSFWGWAGCSSTSLVASWQDESFTTRPMEKLLVLGVFKTDVNRRIYEDGLVQALAAEGTMGVAGYTIMPEASDYDEEKEIRRAVEETGADGVIIAQLKGIEKQERVVPPRVDYYPAMGRRHGLYGYYGASMHTVYQPGYTVEDTLINLEITLFSTQSRKLIWGGETQSVNPSSGKKVTKEAAGLIIKDMKKNGLI